MCTVVAMNTTLKKNSIKINLSGLLALAFVTAFFCPTEALSQTRYWSTRRGIAGALVGRRPSPGVTADSSDTASKATPDSNSAQLAKRSAAGISSRTDARAALRRDLSNTRQEKMGEASPMSSSRRSMRPQGVKVELYIDPSTYAQLQAMSAQTGIPYQNLLADFLRIGHMAWARRLYSNPAPFPYLPR